MAVKYVVQLSSIQDIADAIREKNGKSDTYKPAQMGPAIRELPQTDALFWFGTRQEYNNLGIINPNICYCIEEGS